MARQGNHPTGPLAGISAHVGLLHVSVFLDPRYWSVGHSHNGYQFLHTWDFGPVRILWERQRDKATSKLNKEFQTRRPSLPKPEPSCQNCSFWDRIGPKAQAEACLGYCKFMPATKITIPRWPMTYAGEWCNQHQPKPESRKLATAFVAIVLALLAASVFLGGCSLLRGIRAERKALEAVPGVKLATNVASPWVAVGRGVLDASWVVADLFSGGKATAGPQGLTLLDHPPCPTPVVIDWVPVTLTNTADALPVRMDASWSGPSLRVKPVEVGGMPVREAKPGEPSWVVVPTR